MKVLILDVDGVLTTGQFIYSADGKVLKIFGPDDNDAIKLLQQYIDVRCVTGDRSGFDISARRVRTDMGLQLDLVSTTQRVQWIKDNYRPADVIYMGDGIFDHIVFSEVGYSIAPRNADLNARKNAQYVTMRRGGDRAVAEACLHILDKFFDHESLSSSLSSGKIKFSGGW